MSLWYGTCSVWEGWALLGSHFWPQNVHMQWVQECVYTLVWSHTDMFVANQICLAHANCRSLSYSCWRWVRGIEPAVCDRDDSGSIFLFAVIVKHKLYTQNNFHAHGYLSHSAGRTAQTYGSLCCSLCAEDIHVVYLFKSKRHIPNLGGPSCLGYNKNGTACIYWAMFTSIQVHTCISMHTHSAWHV